MNKEFQENPIFDLEEEMEVEEINSQMEIIGEPYNFMNNNNIIYFGFYEKTSNIFYKIEECRTKKFSISRNFRELEVKYTINDHTRFLFYNLLDNNPTLIKAKNKNFFNYDSNSQYENIIIHFAYSPIHRKKRIHYNITSSYLMDNYNLENNLLCFNCPYKTIFIPKCSKNDLEQINNQLFFHEKREIITDNDIKILSFDDYKQRVKGN